MDRSCKLMSARCCMCTYLNWKVFLYVLMLMADIKNGWRRIRFNMRILIARMKCSKHRTVRNVSVSSSVHIPVHLSRVRHWWPCTQVTQFTHLCTSHTVELGIDDLALRWHSLHTCAPRIQSSKASMTLHSGDTVYIPAETWTSREWRPAITARFL